MVIELLSAPDTARNAGFVFGRFVVFPVLVFAVYYVIVKIAKRRAPTRKETLVLLGIGLLIAIASVAAGSR